MEDTQPIFGAITFTPATEPSTKLRISIGLSDEEFSTKHGADHLEDYKVDKVFRTLESGVRYSVIRHVDEFTQKKIPEIAARILTESQRTKAAEIDLILPEGVCHLGFAKFAHFLNLSNWRFDLRKPESQRPILERVTLVHSKSAEYSAHEDFKFWVQSSVSKNLARDYITRRANVAHVQYFIDRAREIQALDTSKIELTVFHGEKELLGEGLRILYAVGKGSSLPPALVNLTYRGNPSSDEFTALVGKGIVFDQGGANVKTSLIDWMWSDKGGACAVIGAFHAAVNLGLKVNLSCTIALAENVVSSTSYRPSDIITSHKGLTVENLNTDAEGRLVLCDAMSWIQKHLKVATLIDVATLTGACIVALGENLAAAYSTDDDLAASLLKFAGDSNEGLWRMPFCEVIAESMKSKIADLRNISQSQWGGSIQGACFLRYFVDKGVKFAHLDIASTSIKNDPVIGHVGTGQPVATLLGYIRSISA